MSEAGSGYGGSPDAAIQGWRPLGREPGSGASFVQLAQGKQVGTASSAGRSGFEVAIAPSRVVFPAYSPPVPKPSPKRHTRARVTPIASGPRWETPIPRGVAGTYGPLVVAWAKRELGVTLGRWQAYVVGQILRYDRNGDLIARTALLSTARQNGKSLIVRSIVGWALDEGQKLEPFAGWTAILAAAHDSRQARLVYKAVAADIDASPHLRTNARTSIYRGITAGNIDFDIVTNQPGSARGWSAGLIAFDEVLTQRDFGMYESLGPTQSAQRSPLMILTSSAGHSDSLLLRSFYDRLVRQATGAEKPDPTFYGAWWASENPEAGLDWTQIGQANPALREHRLTKRAIKAEHSILPPDSWRRERLNHFVDVVADSAFNPGTWAANRVRNPLAGLTGPYALGVDIQPGWERATICAAGTREDGKVGAEVYRDLRRTEGEPVTTARIIAEVEAFPEIENVLVIAYDQVSGGAPAFLRHHEETGLPWDPLKPAAMVAATMDVTERILAGTLAVDDPLIDAQAAMVAKRPVGQDGAFRFSRQASSGPIDAFMAMTLAVHAVAFIGGGGLIG